MEDVLDVYQRAYDPERAVICMDETCKQLLGEMRAPLSPKPGRPARYDYEYRRNGMANVFLWVEPLSGRVGAQVTERRTRTDWAVFMREVVAEQAPIDGQIVLVMDNLNTHEPASLYEAFPAPKARQIARKLEIHHTPKHGSWLNIAELYLGVLTTQCLDRRIPDIETLRREVAAWVSDRNARRAPVSWQFTTDDARIKLTHLYPSIQTG
jgi:hypothetical protein